MVNPQTGTYAHYYYHYDGQGNVAQLTDANQQVVAQYVYDAFGNTQAGGTQAGQPYRYQTKAYHVASGLYDFGLRYYSPGLGRWLNRDPIKESGGANLYAYAGNSPQRYQDAYGALCMTGWQILATGTAAAATATFAPELLPILPDLFLDGAVDAGLEDAAGEGLLNEAEFEPSCFVAGTLVTMGDGTTKPIEQVKVGEQVLSRDAQTGQTAAKQVTKTFVKQSPVTLVLHFNNGDKVETTKGHPFYVVSKGFVKAGNLSIGTSIVTRAGPSIKVTQIEVKPTPATIYNFTVQDFHSYFVSKAGLWVHNSCEWWEDPTFSPEEGPLYEHGTTYDRARDLLDAVPDPEFPEPGQAYPPGGFSMAPAEGPFPVGSPDQYAMAKDLLFPGEGGPAVLQVNIPDWLVSLGQQQVGGEVRWTAEHGIEALQKAWPYLEKTIRAANAAE